MNLPDDWNPSNIDEVHALLGEPNASFGPDRIRLFAGILVCIVSALFGVYLGLTKDQPGEQNAWMRIGLGPLLFVSSLGGINWIYGLACFRILIYEQALIIRKRALVTVARWESISAISHAGDYVQRFELTLRDGRSLGFNADSVKHTEKLIQMLAVEGLKRGIHCHVLGFPVQWASRSALSIRTLPTVTIRSKVDLARFGIQVERIVSTAERIARAYRQDYLGTEHLLLALLHESPNDATAALDRCGVSLEQVIRNMETEIVASFEGSIDSGPLPPTPRLISSFQSAETELNRMSGASALLLGLIQQADGIAGQALAKAGATAARVREKIEKHLDGWPAIGSAEAKGFPFA